MNPVSERSVVVTSLLFQCKSGLCIDRGIGTNETSMFKAVLFAVKMVQ